MTGEQGCSLGLDCLGQQRSRAVAQHRGQRISKSSWLGDLENTLVSVTAYHSFGGEVELRTPHDTPPHLLMPSPTSAHSSKGRLTWGGHGPNLDCYRLAKRGAGGIRWNLFGLN